MSVKNSTIKEKTEKLNRMVEWFDSDDFVLEEAIDKFNEAQKLALEIEQELNNLKNEVNIVKEKFDS